MFRSLVALSEVWPLQQTRSWDQHLPSRHSMLRGWCSVRITLTFEVFLESKYGHINMENWKKPIFRVKKKHKTRPTPGSQTKQEDSEMPQPQRDIRYPRDISFTLPQTNGELNQTPENPMVQNMVHFPFRGFRRLFSEANSLLVSGSPFGRSVELSLLFLQQGGVLEM